MEAIIVGDLHIDNKKLSVKNSESFDEILSLFNQITDLCIMRKPDFVIFLGDIFDSPTNISTNVISTVSMLFKDLSALSRVVIITGNHDSLDDTKQMVDLINGKKTYLRSSLVYPFGISSDIYVVDEASCSDLSAYGEGYPKVHLSFVPYQLDVISALEKIKDESIRRHNEGFKNVLFGHFETKDLNYVKILQASGGAETVPSSKELFDTYAQDLVVLGHVHEGSSFYSEDKEKRLIYTGSARNINYNNREEVKGLYILNFDTLEMEFIPNTSTAIYKVFRSGEDLDKYVSETPEEKLAKTKIRLIYSDSGDTIKYTGLKKKLRRLEFEKAVFAEETETSDSNGGIDLSELKVENLSTKESLLNFILEFKAVEAEKRQEYIDFVTMLEESEGK